MSKPEGLHAVGWRLLLEPRTMEEATASGIILPDKVKDIEQFGEVVNQVLEVGPLAYKGDRFNDTPWVKEGDWVVIARHAGWRISTQDGEFRVINDDEVIAVLDGPDAIR